MFIGKDVLVPFVLKEFFKVLIGGGCLLTSVKSEKYEFWRTILWALKDIILYGARDTQCLDAYVFYGEGKIF